MTSWTLHDPMFHDLRGHCSFPSTIILGFALLAWLVLLSCRLFHLGFDERWRRRFLFFHLFDPSQSDTKPFLRLFQCLTQFLVLFSQLGRFFFCHDPSLSERSSLNSYEAFKELARESADIYTDYFRSPFSFYQQALITVEAATRQSMEAFQSATETFQKSTR